MRIVLTALGAALLLSGCGATATDLPLPGSSLSGSTYALHAEFDDALNLAVGAPAKVNGVTVGRVKSVSAHDFTAAVTIDIRISSPLHVGATASLRSTTPLGELFVQLTDGKDSARLPAGTTLKTGDTSAAPTIEDTMTAASLVINGGGLGQLQTIVREANAALDGHQQSSREVLSRLATTAKSFNDSAADIDAALDAVAKVSTILNKRQSTINAALTEISPAAKVLRSNTDELAQLLTSVNDLGTTATRIVTATRADLLKTLREIGPVLDQFVALTPEFGPGLEDLVSFASLIDRGVPGDYLNVYLYFQDSMSLGVPSLPGLDGLTGGLPPLNTPEIPDITLGSSGSSDSSDSPDAGLGGLLRGFGGGR